MSPAPAGPVIDSFRQPSGRVEAEIKVKGSRFLAEVIPAPDIAAAQSGLAVIRKRFFDATHHCSASRVGEDGREFRSDDDGEPSGSAGLPILRQIDALGLTNLLVVVTRWFGGTKLGTGGLVRAYGGAAHDALALASIEERILRTTFRLDFSFGDTSPAMHTLSRFDTRIFDTRFGTGTSMDVAVRRSQADSFETAGSTRRPVAARSSGCGRDAAIRVVTLRGGRCQTVQCGSRRDRAAAVVTPLSP